MPEIHVNLIVLRVADLDRSATFYEAMGMEFDRHSHGNGPEHLASVLGDIVFELYPATDKQPVSVSTRTGLCVDDLDATLALVTAVPGVKLVTPIQDSEWGRRAVVADPDGHRVELTQTRLARDSGGT